MFLADKPFESLEAAETYAHDAFSSANYLVLGKHANMTSTMDFGPPFLFQLAM